MTIKVYCWNCAQPLVGKGGSWKARPLIFAEVENQIGQKVRVHKVCEEAAKASVRRVTAQPSDALPMKE